MQDYVIIGIIHSLHLLGIQRVAIFDDSPDHAFWVEHDQKMYSCLTMVQWYND